MRPEIIERILEARGYSSEEQKQKLLSPRLSDLKSPFLMAGMQAACELLKEAFQLNKAICIYADFDLDGTSGCALAFNAMRDLGYTNLSYYQPQRLSEGYGFHASAVEELHKKGVQLIVTVDVGISSQRACERARELGIQTIITDHHLAPEVLPAADVIVNPNQPTCSSGLGYLCGAGVVFYLLRALKRTLVDAELIEASRYDLRSSLDCLAIATLTDMVPLIEDNRALTKVGLVELERTQRPGLKALLQKLDMAERPLSSQDVAIRFAPKLNALSRMESGLRPLDIYLVDTAEKAQRLVGQVMQNNIDRVQHQGDGEELAFKMLETWPHTSFIFLASNKFHRGVVGLIATKLAIAKGVPCFIASIPLRESNDEDQSGIVGSGRLPPGSGSSLIDSLEHVSEFLSRYGGHKQAAGFELKREEDIPKLTQQMSEYYKHLETPKASLGSKYDVEVGVAEVNENLLKWIDVLGPFGKNFEMPLLCLNESIVSSMKKIKGDHLKIQLRCKRSQVMLDSVWFSPPKSIELTEGDHVRAIGEVQWNYFGAKPKVQFLLREILK